MFSLHSARRIAALLLVCFAGLAARGDDGIAAPVLAQLKSATVFIKVQAGTYRASGTGFLVHADGETGYIVTNDHVVRLPPRTVGRTISLVFGSDTPTERTVTADVVASNAEDDLAILKVTGFKGLPQPLKLGDTPKLMETMTVYAFGFPFGQALAVKKGANPAITVGKGSISSLRYNDKRDLAAVQIDGDLNPGNSGGPVVDTQGRLVGVAVAKFGNTRIGLAIPTTELASMFEGRAGTPRLRQVGGDKGKVELEAEVELFDPFGKVKEVSLQYATHANLRDVTKGLTGLPTQKLALKVENQKAVGKLSLSGPEGTELIVTAQATAVNAAGKSQAGSATLGRFKTGGTLVAKVDPPKPPDPKVDPPKPPDPSTKTLPPKTTDPAAKVLTEAELTKALGDLKSGKHFQITKAADLLAGAAPDAKMQPAVARALETGAADSNTFIRRACANALGAWGTAESVDVLLKYAGNEEKDIFMRRVAITGLGKLRATKAIDLLVELFPNNFLRSESDAALKRIGSAAEKAALAKLLAHSEVFVRAAACGLLKEIGTKESVPALEQAQKTGGIHVSGRAAEALKEIAARQK